MRINKKLNLVIPVEIDDKTYYVHSTPLSREVFENYFLVISKTFAAIHAEGLGDLGGPRVAYLMLRKIAQDSGIWEGIGGVENGLLKEIERLSVVIAPTESGWRTMPLDSAIKGGIFNDDDKGEVMGFLVFFICISAMHKSSIVEITLNMMNALWGTQTTLSDSTEFLNSLPILTATDNSGETATLSSIPS